MAGTNWDMETDVAVVGGGLAGYCAALQAAEAGAQVLLLEKQPQIGGSTVLSGGFLAFAGTDMQREAGVEDSAERLLRDLRNAGGNENDPALLQVYVEEQLQVYQWLKDRGVPFKAVQISSAQSVPRTHPLDPLALMNMLADLAQQTGRVRTLLQAPALRLVRTKDTDPVVGVSANIGGEHKNIRARAGVVLASGGFSLNEEMLKNFAPAQAKAVRYGGAGNTGDGLKMAWQLGAGLRDMAYIKGTFGFHVNSRQGGGRDWTKLFVYRGAIAVNKHGRRYVDESLGYKLLGDAVLQQPDAMGYQVFDQAIMDTAAPGVSPFDFASAYQRGLVHKAATLEQLAGQTGLDPQALSATVARYNRFVDQGSDEDFGRDGLSTHYGKLAKIERAPFYAYAATSAVIGTYCGVTVDAGARVHNVFDEPIEGLFAAGEIMGGFHGVAYMTGTALGKAMIFGRIAGRNAAARLRLPLSEPRI